MIVKYLLPAGVVLALLAGAYFRGASDKETELTQQYQQAYIDQFELYRAKERQLQAQADEASAIHAKEMLDVQENIDSMLDEYRTKRVFVRTKTKCASVPEAAGDKAGSDKQAGRAELHPEIVKRIIEIGKECDALAVDFNYLKSLAR